MKILHLMFFLPFLLFQIGSANAQKKLSVIEGPAITCEEGIDLSRISFRGLDVVSDKVVWVSGNKGTFGRSTDGGLSFKISRIKGFDSTDFRSIKAFNADQAIVVSSGSPGYILKTYDGGETWKKVFEDKRKEFFLDAIDFWDDDNGMVIGDPIEERFILYRTIDGGNTWHPMDTSMRPWAIAGESLFAASGTSFRCMPKKSIGFVTGGKISVFHWLQIDKKYQRFELKSMKQGKQSEGAFSFDFNDKYIAIVGGDYTQDTAKVKQAIYKYSYDKDGLQLMNMKPFYTNYRSCVELLNNSDFITCGTKGVDMNNTEQTVTISNGKTQVSFESFNVVKQAKNGSLIILAGSKGKLARIE